ncbi:MAG TPA: prolyl-tRNA synthetase [Candidatus Wolfebacteria bacterium]|nr:prolyl-tRNA synthetase [Candidatus Wolfebacteria bacterium]
MFQSQLFTKTQKEAPKDEEAINAKLLIRGGFVDKLMAGVYTFLPLGLIVLKKIENIIRDEMIKAGGQEILMPTLHPKRIWESTGRWEMMDDLYKLKDKSGKDFALGSTHEEVITPLMKKFIISYNDLPKYVFQIQNKFRDEPRAKSGLLRTREFIMKDLYSFHSNEKDMEDYYDEMKVHYKNIFDACGIGRETFITFASGGSFSKYSHEFQTITEAGEDKIFLCEKCKIAVNSEIIDNQNSCPECGNKDLIEKKAIEVGNIFKLKTKFSDSFELKFTDKDGLDKDIIMGCYGIGPARVMGAIIEVHHDENGIIWPKNIAPFQVHLLSLGKNKKSEKVYNSLKKQGIEVLYDDRDDSSAGEKFTEADLIGIPYRAVISEKTGDKIEIKKRCQKDIKLINEKELIKML